MRSLAFVILACSVAHATPYESGGKVDEFVGAYSHSVPILVTPFHGIEPRLSLDYNSNAGNTVLGVGWSLQGLSVIEQDDGSYGETGMHFMMDGELLIPCSSQQDFSRNYAGSMWTLRSPSCISVGFTDGSNRTAYSTLSESYLAIERGSVSSSPTKLFVVTRPDGTRMTYLPVAGSTLVAKKFLLSTVTDVNGNTVTYTWHSAADGFSFNTPRTIEYNGTVISFRYTPRDVPETYAQHGVFETMNRQLVTIDVCVNATATDTTPCSTSGIVDSRRARAYSIGYRTSAATGRPLVTTIQQIGKNATMNAAGVVVGGDRAPGVGVTWVDPAPSYSTTTIGPIAQWGHDWIRGMADFNGDGRTDFCRDVAVSGNPSNLACALSTGSGMTDTFVGTIADWGDDQANAWVDWNGDNRADYCRVVCRDNSGGACDIPWEDRNYSLQCAFSTGTGITDLNLGALTRGQQGGRGTRWWVDWNGDGRTDYCRAYDANAGTGGAASANLVLKCALSNGNTFVDQLVGGFDEGGGDLSLDAVLGIPETRAMVDWNGDGRTDLCRVIDDGNGDGQIKCLLGHVNEFTRTTPSGGQSNTDVAMGTVNDFGLGDAQWWTDLNGDGKTDYCRGINGTTVRCAMSQQGSVGATMEIDLTSATGWGTGAGAALSRRWGDVNGDGKADLCFDTGSGAAKTCAVSTGLGVVLQPTGVIAPSFYEKHWMVDWDGDGRSDYCFNAGSAGGGGSTLQCVFRNAGSFIDIATSFTNGIGGTTSIAYAQSRLTGLAHPKLAVVSSITQSGGGEGPTTKSFVYSGGVFDAWTRSFLGFTNVRTTDPCLVYEAACPFTDTVYRLDFRWPAAATRTQRFRAAPSLLLLEQHDYQYVDSTLSPFRSELIGETVTLRDGVDMLQMRTEYTYDVDGNLVTQTDRGAVTDTTGLLNLSDDDRWIDYTYAPDFTKYITDKPVTITGRDVFGQLTSARFTYDDRGRATKTEKWLDTANAFVATTATYDNAGNVVQETDGNGRPTNYTMDTSYNQYIASTTLFSGHVKNATWDPQCSEKRAETVPANSATTQYTYDTFCRLTRTDFPGGNWEAVNYNNASIGTSGQHTEVSRPGPSGSLWKRTYFDAFGRTTKVTRRGPGSNVVAGGIDIIETEMTYDKRGNVSSNTRPRYANGPMYGYTRLYDAKNREVAALMSPATIDGVSHPGEVRTTAYNVLATTVRDGMGHAETTWRDGRDRVFWVGSTDGTTNPRDLTTYAYDRFGNVSTISQWTQYLSFLATTTFTWDSLGRKLSALDPDSGYRTYGYDNNGNLTLEIDASNIMTRYYYDVINRRTGKTTNWCKKIALCPAMSTVYWGFDEARPGFANAGRLTSMTDASGVATYNYDVAGNLVNGGRSVDGTQYTFLKQYDLGGRLLSTTYPDGSRIGTTTAPIRYDEAGRVLDVPSFVYNATYDASDTLVGYTAENGASATYSTANPRGQISSYRVEGAVSSPQAVIGDYSATNTANATQSSRDIQIAYLQAGQTVRVTTCSASVPGASATGDTVLRLMRQPFGSSQMFEIASNDNAYQPGCGFASTVVYAIPFNKDGIYFVRAGCAGASTCSGTISVRIETPGPNLSLNQPVSQSSFLNQACGPSSAVVDGNPNGVWCSSSSMLHTEFQANPWMMVDLGSDQDITRINVWNRNDCDATCLARLANYDIFVWNVAQGQWTHVAFVPDIAARPTQIPIVARGRYVYLALRGTDFLNIPELEVFGKPLTSPQVDLEPVYENATLTRDADGRITRIERARSRASWTFAYTADHTHQLASANNLGDPSLSQSYETDNGNLTIVHPTTYGEGYGVRPHAITQSGSTTFRYDANGQQTQSSASGNATWDHAHRLTSYAGTSYTYDADGHRLKRTSPSGTTIYLGDDYEIANGVHTTYVTLGGRLVAKQDGSAPPTFLFTDHLGSVILGLDEQGALAFTGNYGPYGETIDGNDSEGRGFTGQTKDENGLVYLHARFMDPATGRFLSPDPTIPTQSPIGMNRYAYAMNDPVNRTDIDGLGWGENVWADVTFATGEAAKFLRHLNLVDNMKHKRRQAIAHGIPECVGSVCMPRLEKFWMGPSMGIGNVVSLLPNSINAAGRGDWNAFGKSVAYEVVISAAIATSIISYGTAAAPAVAAVQALAMPAAFTFIDSGDPAAAGMAALGAIPSLFIGHGSDFAAPLQERKQWAKWDFKDEYAYAPKSISPGAVVGTLIGTIIGADTSVAIKSHLQATSSSTQSRLSSATGSRFGYGYGRRGPRR
jgi:RHS repeat-associated protein